MREGRGELGEFEGSEICEGPREGIERCVSEREGLKCVGSKEVDGLKFNIEDYLTRTGVVHHGHHVL